MTHPGTLYAHGFDDKELELIQQIGFAIRPGVGHYAGSQSMRFVDFEALPSLELIQVSDPDEYAAFVPAGMTPYCPGVSIVVENEGVSALQAYSHELEAWGPYLVHVPYKSGPEPNLPGWHYLNLAKPLVPDTFVYLTSYDEPRPHKPIPAPHPNRAYRVTAMVFDLPSNALAPLQDLMEGAGHPVVRPNRIQLLDASAVPVATRSGGKVFPLVAVVVEVSDLSRVPVDGSWSQRTIWQAREAVLVRMNRLAWDLVLTE